MEMRIRRPKAIKKAKPILLVSHTERSQTIIQSRNLRDQLIMNFQFMTWTLSFRVCKGRQFC